MGYNITGNALEKKYLVLLVILLIATFAYSALYLKTPLPEMKADNSIKKFSSYAEMESFVKASSESYGYYSGAVGQQMALKGEKMASSSLDTGGAPTSVPLSLDQSSYSKTNIQTEGVDEADIVKNDGKYIYTVTGNTVAIIDAYPAENAKIASKIDINGTVYELFINENKLVVFAQMYETYDNPEATLSEPGVAEKMIMRPTPVYSPKTSVLIYDISDRSNPEISGNITIDGNYYDSRMIGSYIYIIASQPVYYYSAKQISVPEIKTDSTAISQSFPEIYYFEDVPVNAFTTIAAVNIDNPQDISGRILLTSYAQSLYVSQKNIYITYTRWLSESDYTDRMVDIVLPLVPLDIQEKIRTVIALDISKQTKWQAIGEILQKYSATLSDEERNALEQQASAKMEELQNEIAKEREKTIVQKISIDNGNIEYIANGEVPGTVLNQFSMDEYNGYFRIATTTSTSRTVAIASGTAVASSEQFTQTSVSEETSAGTAPQNAGISEEEQRKIDEVEPVQKETAPSPPVQRSGPSNNIYVLDATLNIVGKLEDLASGERIYSARFLGDKAYMVTFRQVDPLFVLDLSSPQDPKVLGYLKIPGVSDYLHPYDETHIIGVGRDATEEGRMQGMKLSLFDITDFANPKEISKYMIGESGTYSEVLNDHKAFLFSKGILVFPVQVVEGGKWNAFQGAYVFSINLDTGFGLRGKITHQNETSTDDYYNYDYNRLIRRSLYIGDILYTVSNSMVKMSNISDISDVNRIDLPVKESLPVVYY